MIVSSFLSIPPPNNISLLSKDKSLNLAPKTGSSEQPFPFPPVSDIFVTALISKSCGSTNIFSTLPVIIGSTKAVVPELDSIVIVGGLGDALFFYYYFS